MFIKGLNKKIVTTKFGEKEKWIVTDESGRFYDSWVGKWNADWQEGDTIDIKESQIQSREWEGKTFYTIQAPPEARSFGQQIDLSPVMDALRKIYIKLDHIEQQLEKNEMEDTKKQMYF